ncbi:phage baseplate assembly protein V [Pseudochelatococcus sp. B33]
MVAMLDMGRQGTRFYGKYSGTVDAASEPDARGLIKVRVPSIFGVGGAVWARPCLPYGHFYLPPPGTHVWVEFEAGNPEYPIWVGVWYPEGSAPPETQETPQTERVIQTPFGHTLHISDKDGEEKITLRHGANAFLALADDGSVILSNNKGANLFLDADGTAATLQSESGHLITMSEDSILIAGKDGASVEIKGDTVNVLAPKVNISGTSVALGAGAAEPTVMGNQFKILWTLLQGHVHPTAMGPSGPAPTLAVPLLDGVHLSSAVVVK